MKQKKLARIAFIIVILIAGYPTIQAATRHVPADYTTIQAAVDASNAGDTIIVADGVYSGQGNRDIDMRYKALNVRSENGPDTCIIDCTAGNYGFQLTSGLIDGFTIRNASGTGFGLFFAEGGGAAANCILTDCKTGAYGGYCFDVTLTDCLIQNNSDDGVFCSGGSMFLYNCIVRNSGRYGAYNRDISLMELSNCLVENGVFTTAASETHMTNCTIIGNVSNYMECYSTLLNCILWDGFIDTEASSAHSVTYSDAPTLYSGEGNISQDPLFVSGPYGDYYLSQAAAGQSEDSPCVDAGNADASVTCFDAPSGFYCLDTLTTRSDVVTDTGTVDMGFHYNPESSAPPTPTPTPTPPPPDQGVHLHLNSDTFSSGDRFLLEVTCYATPGYLYDLYIALDVCGGYWFYPHWTTGLDNKTITIDDAEGYEETVFDFLWPAIEINDSVFAAFWGLMMNHATYDIVGSSDYIFFQFM